MRISTKGDYGLALMVGLARRPGRASVSLRELAEAERVPYAYAEQLVVKLKRARLLASTRGSRGGYRLVRPSDRITVGEIVHALEEDQLLPCQAGADADGGRVCPREADCSTHDVWSAIQLSLRRTMDRITLHDLLKKR